MEESVKHDGDCSIYMGGGNICDCGALRRTIRKQTHSNNEELWEAWAKHTADLDDIALRNIHEQG